MPVAVAANNRLDFPLQGLVIELAAHQPAPILVLVNDRPWDTWDTWDTQNTGMRHQYCVTAIVDN